MEADDEYTVDEITVIEEEIKIDQNNRFNSIKDDLQVIDYIEDEDVQIEISSSVVDENLHKNSIFDQNIQQNQNSIPTLSCGEDPLEDSLDSIPQIKEEILDDEDSFLASHISMKFQNVKPSYEKKCEVYCKESGDFMMDNAFSNSVKIETRKQIGTGDKLYKVFNNEKISDLKFREMYKEFRIGCSLKHPGVVKYFYFIRCNSQKHGQKEQEFHILIELCEGGNLDQYQQQIKRVEDKKTLKNLILQITEAIAYLHSQNIVHQDLKPQNILFSKDYKIVKLCDFGISNRVEQTKATAAARSGSIRFMAPEQLDDLLSSKADIWALGCIILQLVTGHVPYEGLHNDFKIWQESSQRGPLVYAEKTFGLCPMFEKYKELRDFVQLCLQTDHTQRPSAQQLLKHIFLSN